MRMRRRTREECGEDSFEVEVSASDFWRTQGSAPRARERRANAEKAEKTRGKGRGEGRGGNGPSDATTRVFLHRRSLSSFLLPLSLSLSLFFGSSLFSMSENNKKLTAKNAKSAGNNPVFP
jgi:hypothetical protein